MYWQKYMYFIYICTMKCVCVYRRLEIFYILLSAVLSPSPWRPLFSYRYMIADFEYRIIFKIYNMTENWVAHFSRRMTFELKILWTIIYATKIWLYYCFADWSFKLKLTRMKKISLDNNTVAMNLVKKNKKVVFVERN